MICARCKGTASDRKRTGVPYEAMPLCATCFDLLAEDDEREEEQAAEEDEETCGTCLGTGIGQHGDPDTSTCHDCGGGGGESLAARRQARADELADRDDD